MEDKNASETNKDGETRTLIRVCKSSVLLQTARAVATNGSRSKPVRILFDTGSQRSYVTNDLAKQLKLTPLKRETLHLNTFGNSQTMKIVNFSSSIFEVRGEMRALSLEQLAFRPFVRLSVL